MKTRYTGFITILLAGIYLITACEEKDEREVFPHSTPLVEGITVSPVSLGYGDSVTITAKLSDPLTPLSTVKIKMTVDGQEIAADELRTPGQQFELSTRLKTNYISKLPENGKVITEIILTNVEGDETIQQAEEITGKRKYYSSLYLVLDNGDVKELLPQPDNPDRYKADTELKNTVRYKIAEKLTDDQQIDYTADVWGYMDEKIQLTDQKGDYITTSEPMKESTESVIFDTYEFRMELEGEDLMKVEKFELELFAEEVKQETETYHQGSFYLEKDQEIELSADFADVLFNLDYFDRIAQDKVKYLGETGPLVLDYNSERKYMLVQEVDPAYPNVLLICGEGLGYPSKSKPEATTGWGFDRIAQYVIFRRIEENIYQGTIYMDAEKVNFKPFENKAWGNEKRSDDYILPDILIDSDTKSEGTNLDGNWYASPEMTSGNFRMVINLSTKKVTATEITLP